MPESREQHNAYRREWYRKNREKILAWQKRYRDTNKEKVAAAKKRYYEANKEEQYARVRAKHAADPGLNAAYYRKSAYGMTREDYEERYGRQEGCCAICGTPKDVLFVDHCHDTGRIRGLLCQNCNCGLGHFKDSPAHLYNAIAYLNYHSDDDEQECCYGPPRACTNTE